MPSVTESVQAQSWVSEHHLETATARDRNAIHPNIQANAILAWPTLRENAPTRCREKRLRPARNLGLAIRPGFRVT